MKCPRFDCRGKRRGEGEKGEREGREGGREGGRGGREGGKMMEGWG